MYLTTYSGNKLPPFYVGYCRTDKISKGYHGSVSSAKYKSIWVNEIEQHPNLFTTTIISTYDTNKDAALAENRVQRRLDVVHNPLYINRASFPHFLDPSSLRGKRHSPTHRANNSRAQKALYVNGYVNPFKGKSHKIDTIDKIKQQRALQVTSGDTRIKMSKSRIAFWESPDGLALKAEMKNRPANFKGCHHSVETLDKLSKMCMGRPSAFKGKSQSEETRQKMRDAWKKRKEMIA